MDISQADFVIEEYSEQEWQEMANNRSRPSTSASSSIRSRSATSSNRNGTIDRNSRLSRQQRPHLSSVDSESSPNTLQTVAAPGSLLEGNQVCPTPQATTSAIDINSEAWPGRVLDVAVPAKLVDSLDHTKATLALEGFHIQEIIQQIAFLWGLIPAPISVLRSNAQVSNAPAAPPPTQLVDISLEPQHDDQPTSYTSTRSSLADVGTLPNNATTSILTTSSATMDTFSPSNTIPSATTIEIEHYEPDQRPGKRVYSFNKPMNDDDEEEEPQQTRISQRPRQNPVLGVLNSIASQLETVRRLLWEETCSTSFLSHLFFFVGSSIGTSKAALVISRSPLRRLSDTQRRTYTADSSTENMTTQFASPSTEPLPVKTKEQDSQIRSTLRRLLQTELVNSITGDRRPKGQAKVHLVASFSTLPGCADPPSLPASASSLPQVRVPQILTRKWQSKRPVLVIRFKSDETPPSSQPEHLISLRLGPPIAFGYLH